MHYYYIGNDFDIVRKSILSVDGLATLERERDFPLQPSYIIQEETLAAASQATEQFTQYNNSFFVLLHFVPITFIHSF
jgi:hypothetical protein